MNRIWLSIFASALFFFANPGLAQEQRGRAARMDTAAVPRLIKFSGALTDELGKPRTGVVGLSLGVYATQEGGNPLWIEVQNAELDAQGRYTVLLGATKSEGVPVELFTASEPRWLGVQSQ